MIAYLKAMVLYVAQGYHWSEDIAEYVRWSEQMDLWCKMRFFGTQLEEEILQEVKQINASPQNRGKTVEIGLEILCKLIVVDAEDGK